MVAERSHLGISLTPLPALRPQHRACGDPGQDCSEDSVGGGHRDQGSSPASLHWLAVGSCTSDSSSLKCEEANGKGIHVGSLSTRPLGARRGAGVGQRGAGHAQVRGQLREDLLWVDWVGVAGPALTVL